jgi:hypothetical protein
MIKLEGTVLNTYHLDGGTNKKGEEYEARDKVQLLGSLELPNGQIKNELIDLTVEDSRIYDDSKTNLLASVVVLALGKMLFLCRKGAKPV